MHKIPMALIWSRLLIGFVIIGLSLAHIPQYRWLAIGLLTLGLLSDIFDGIIARKLGILHNACGGSTLPLTRYFLFA